MRPPEMAEAAALWSPTVRIDGPVTFQGRQGTGCAAGEQASPQVQGGPPARMLTGRQVLTVAPVIG